MSEWYDNIIETIDGLYSTLVDSSVTDLMDDYDHLIEIQAHITKWKRTIREEIIKEGGKAE